MKILLLLTCLFGCIPCLLLAAADTANSGKSEFIQQYNIANDFYQGTDQDQNYTEALKWYAKVIEFEPGQDRTLLMLALRQKSVAYERLAFMFNNGKGTQKNQQQALKLYKRGLILYQQLQIYTSSYSEYQNSIVDIKREISKLENNLDMNTSMSSEYTFDLNTLIQQAQSGNLEAQNELGDYYYGTNYKFVNMPEAIKWYEKAAAKNHSSAIFSLGYLHELGKGVKVDKDKGESYFLRLGSKKLISEIILAHLYETGRGREKNLDYALELYQKLPSEVAAADAIRVQRKLKQGTAVKGDVIAYQNNPVTAPVAIQERIKNRVQDVMDTQEKTMPYAVFMLLGGIFTVVLVRKLSKSTHGVKNQTVSAARILLDVGDYSAAREMLLNYLQDNPDDDRARELLQQTVRIH